MITGTGVAVYLDAIMTIRAQHISDLVSRLVLGQLMVKQ